MQKLITHIMVPLMAVFFAMAACAHVAQAAPLHIPYNNHQTSDDGGLTVALAGDLVVLYHANIKVDPIMEQMDACGNQVPVIYINSGLMVRPVFDVTDVATGDTYRLKGHFKDSRNAFSIYSSELCGNVWTYYFTDTVDLITPTNIRPLVFTFYVQVNTDTAELMHIEVADAQLR